jgi:hypothetical protein
LFNDGAVSCAFWVTGLRKCHAKARSRKENALIAYGVSGA